MTKDYWRMKVRKYWEPRLPAKLSMVVSPDLAPSFNQSCHYNADALVRQGKAVAIVECLLVNDDHVTLHYVSLGSDMQCFDSTLGPLYLNADYRLIQVLRSMPGDDPHEQLCATKTRMAIEAGLPAWARLLYGQHAFL